MAKSRAPSGQIAFMFDPPQPATHAAALAGIDARIARVVAEALNGDSRSRAVLAAEITDLMAEPVSKLMLDAYASPARADFNISFSRMLALVAVTKRFDLLDRELREIGAAVLIGEEIHAARLGHLKAQRAAIDAEIKAAERIAKPISRGQE